MADGEKRVYFLRRADGTGPIKIGCSEFPQARADQISCDLKTEIEIMASVPGDFIAERNAHLKFAHLLVRHPKYVRNGRHIGNTSEWFSPAPELLEFINAAKATGVLPLSDTECRERVMAQRYLGGETLQQIAVDFAITRERVRQILRKTGVPSLGFRPEHHRPAHELTFAEKRAVALYDGGVPPKQIYERTGVQPHVLTKALQRLGVAKKPKGHWLTKPNDAQLTAQVCSLYEQGLSAPEILSAIPELRFPTTVYRYLEKGGVPARNANNRSRFEDQASAIIEAYRAGATQAQIADHFGASTPAIAKLLHRHGASLTPAERERRRIAKVIEANKRRARKAAA